MFIHPSPHPKLHLISFFSAETHLENKIVHSERTEVVMRMTKQWSYWRARLAGICLALCALVATAQTHKGTGTDLDRTKAISRDESRAEQAAQDMVSLSADKIIAL